jgi:uncharacterized protein (AIM24 family)
MELTGDQPYELVAAGDSIFFTVLGDEGLGMKFTGPQVVFTQSHNFNNLVT